MATGKKEAAFSEFFQDARAGSALVAFSALAAWCNSFFVPFLLDDRINILENPSIKSLAPLSRVFSAPAGTGSAGRPLLNLSFAVNYAISGLSPLSYHVLNLLVHIMAGVVLYGLLRRAFGSQRLSPALGDAAPVLALAAALCWTLHPLTTESVTYVTQRAESMMGLFFLLTVYCSVRGFGKKPANLWHAGAIAAFLAGAATKEVIVVAPLLVLAWDAVFNETPVGAALKRSRLLYAGYAAGIAGLFILVSMGGTAGADPLDHDIGRFRYLVVQGGAILRYIRLSFLPVGLSFDYWDWDTTLSAAAFLKAGIVGCLFIVSAWGLYKRHPAGYAGAWFFLILAPTSSLMPLKYPVYEHRMYLPLAAVVSLAVAGFYRGGVKLSRRPAVVAAKKAGRAGAVFAAAAVFCLGGLTLARNHDYRSELALWADTLKKRPDNPKAHLNIAMALENAGDAQEALHHYEVGRKINDIREQSGALFNMGNILARAGKKAEAENCYRQAMKIRRVFPKAMVNLASLVAERGGIEEAGGLYEDALRCDPSLVEGHFNYANLLAQQGLYAQAAEHYREAVFLAPGLSAARVNLAVCLTRMKN